MAIRRALIDHSSLLFYSLLISVQFDASSLCCFLFFLHSLLYTYLYHIFYQCNLETVSLLSWEMDPSCVAPPEVSSVFLSLFFFTIWQFLTRIEDLRTEDVVHCTDCKAY